MTTTKGTMAIDGFVSLLGTSHKSDLSDAYSDEYLTTIMYLTPYITNVDGIDRNLCPFAAMNLCHGPCLETAGRGIMAPVRIARKARTLLYWRDRTRFMDIARSDLRRHRAKAIKNRRTAVARLNGLSDIAFETTTLMAEFPDIIFYDYTKSLKRMKRYLAGQFPANYSLTFSRGAGNDDECAQVLALGGNVAMVWRTFAAIPIGRTFTVGGVEEVINRYGGTFTVGGVDYPVINGVEHDLRFLDPKGVIVGLKALGKAKQDHSGFVLD